MKHSDLICLTMLACCCSQIACTFDQNQLAGNWQAVAFYENGKTRNVPLDSVVISLDNQGGYQFRSQGFYQESGSYRISASYLFLTDTSVRPALQHTVKVLDVSDDSLKIEMSSADKTQVLFFARRP